MKIDLTQLKDLSWDEAADLITQETTCGRKIIGVSGSPGSGYPDGIYVTVASSFAKSEHVRVGDRQATPVVMPASMIPEASK